MEDPAAGGMEGIEPAAPEQSGFTICVKVSPEGLAVGIEPPEGAEGMEETYQPVASMQELMQTIASMIKSGGQPSSRAEEQAGFEQGFAG